MYHLFNLWRKTFVLADSALPNKAKERRFCDIRRCIGCNDGCVGVLFTDHPITCVLNPMLGHEYEGEIETAPVKKKVAVVGAGPAGLYAAIAAAKRGHEVTVYEKGKHAGGNFYTASIPPCKGEITDFIVWQTTQCRQLGVEIKYETEATAKLLKEEKADTVILATVSEVTEEGVVYKDQSGELHTIAADTVVVAAGYRANNPLEEELIKPVVNIRWD